MVHFKLKSFVLQDLFFGEAEKEFSREAIAYIVTQLPKVLELCPKTPDNEILETHQETYQDVKNLLQSFERLLRENPHADTFKFMPIGVN